MTYNWDVKDVSQTDKQRPNLIFHLLFYRVISNGVLFETCIHKTADKCPDRHVVHIAAISSPGICIMYQRFVIERE